MNIKLKEVLAKAALFGATLIWGSSFFIMKNTVSEIETFYLLAFRFSVATIVLGLIFHKKLKLLDKGYIIKGSIMGFLLFCAYTFQTFGIQRTTPGKNAFLTTVYCVIVPFLYWAYARKKPKVNHILASFICIIGIALISLDQSLTMGVGDSLTLVGGLFYAMHIVAVASFSKNRDIFLLTVIQFLSAALLGWVFGLGFNNFPQTISQETVTSLIYLCFFATTIALFLQNLGQKYTHASTASIILSFESVFGVLFSVIFYHEKMTLRLVIGFAFIFMAIIASELNIEFFKKSKKESVAKDYIREEA